MKKILVAAFVSVAILAAAAPAMAFESIAGSGHFGKLEGSLVSTNLKQDGGKKNAFSLGVIASSSGNSIEVNNFNLGKGSVISAPVTTDATLISIALTGATSTVKGGITFSDVKQLGGIGNSASGIVGGAFSSNSITQNNFFNN